MTSLAKVLGYILHQTVVHDSSLVQENQMIKGVEDFRSGLMDGEQDTGTSIGNFLQHLTELNSVETIQTGGWLLQWGKHKMRTPSQHRDTPR